MTIELVVCDDQALIRAGFTTIFDSQPDLTVVGEASDGRSAVDLVRRLRPSVVVMDVRMPVMDGIAATEQLAGPGVTDPVKVLVVTTFNIDEYVYQALRAGASGFLLKDASPEQLIDGVRTVARGEALIAPAVTREHRPVRRPRAPHRPRKGRGRPADTPRTGGAQADRGGPLQRRDRGEPGDRARNRQDVRVENLHQARRA